MVTFWATAIGILAGAAVASMVWRPGLLLAVVALPFLYIAVILAWTSHRLGPRGDDVQARIHELLIQSVGAGGRLLDIGCGSGQLLIRFAKSAPGDYVGLDHWGADWCVYSQAQAERNAELEDVPSIEFVHASASRLPFRDEGFEKVVSCLTFHEVRDADDRTVSVSEALRVLEPGGRFAFVDLFDDPKSFAGRERVLAEIEASGGDVREVKRLAELLELRFPLTLGRVLKYAVFVSGTKSSAS